MLSSFRIIKHQCAHSIQSIWVATFGGFVLFTFDEQQTALRVSLASLRHSRSFSNRQSLHVMSHRQVFYACYYYFTFYSRIFTSTLIEKRCAGQSQRDTKPGRVYTIQKQRHAWRILLDTLYSVCLLEAQSDSQTARLVFYFVVCLNTFAK